MTLGKYAGKLAVSHISVSGYSVTTWCEEMPEGLVNYVYTIVKGQR